MVDGDADEEVYLRESRNRREKGLRSKESKNAKHQTHKARMQELTEQLPAETQTMRRVVQQHARYLLGLKERGVSGLPAPPTDAERDLAVQRGKGTAFDQPFPTTEASMENHTRALSSMVQTRVRELGLTVFTFDWMSGWKQPFNQVMDVIFYRTLDVALRMGEYSNLPWSPEHATHAIVSAHLEKYFNHLQTEYKLLQKSGTEAVEERNRKQRLRKKRERLARRRQDWCDENGLVELAAQFNDPAVCSDTEEVLEDGVIIFRKTRLDWRSAQATKLMEHIDHQILVASRIGRRKKQPKFEERRAAVRDEEDTLYPEKLLVQFYNANWLGRLDGQSRERLNVKQVDVMDAAGMPLCRNPGT